MNKKFFLFLAIMLLSAYTISQTYIIYDQAKEPIKQMATFTINPDELIKPVPEPEEKAYLKLGDYEPGETMPLSEFNKINIEGLDFNITLNTTKKTEKRIIVGYDYATINKIADNNYMVVQRKAQSTYMLQEYDNCKTTMALQPEECKNRANENLGKKIYTSFPDNEKARLLGMQTKPSYEELEEEDINPST